ncbi:DUF3152 domain-containing protein [Streptomyces sp. NPDC016845]|uniref:DUF3152 domain-containing protein n=1 Tax=Streptomyces sp. NPDC016845 TaxID=3364972 RepID=UPI0037913716
MRHAKKPSVRRRRPRARGGVRLLGLLALGVITSLTLLMVYGNEGTAGPSGEAGAGTREPRISAAPKPSELTGPPKKPKKPKKESKQASEKGSEEESEKAPASGSAGPTSGPGTFDTASASGTAVGKGTIRRYKVQVEHGTGISAEAAAKEIDGVLGDPRGWTADGRDGFRLVASGPYDFEVKIATPDTVDRICGAAGLHTRGEVNCDVGDQVIVNLKRWNTGSPQFAGPLHEYRALIINHEVGHRIGHGHETCPGPGRPAPAMMQQIDGLKGCRANAWPYDGHGTYLGGPSVP